MKTKLFALAAVLALGVAPAHAQYMVDDGSGELAAGRFESTPWSYLWGVNYVALDGANVITSVEVCFGNGSPALSNPSLNGDSVTAFVASVNADGTLAQGGILASVTGSIQDWSTDIPNVFDTPDVLLTPGTRFFVGALYHRVPGMTAEAYPARMDFGSSNSIGRSYAAYSLGGLIDPNNIEAVPSGQRGFIETWIPGDFMVRANGRPVPEPTTVCMVLAGLAALRLRKRR